MLLKRKKTNVTRVMVLVALAVLNPACGGSSGGGSPPVDTVNDNQAMQPLVEGVTMRTITTNHGLTMQLLS